MAFQRALDFVLAREGGYVNDPDDRGGATNHGITQTTYDAWRAPKDPYPVEEITQAEVEAIYRELYWLKGRCDVLHWPLDLVHFDGCVQHGVGRAVKMLQRVVGTQDDGMIGPYTLDAVARVVERGQLYDAANALLWERLKFYRQIVKHDSTQMKFLYQWVTRLEHLWDAIR